MIHRKALAASVCRIPNFPGMMAISYPQGKFTGSGKSERESVRQRLRFILNEKTKVDWQVSEPEILFPILSSFLPTHDDGCLDKSVRGRQMAEPPERAS